MDQCQYEYSDPLTAPDPVTMWIPAEVPIRSAPAVSSARTCSTVLTPPDALTPIDAGTDLRREPMVAGSAIPTDPLEAIDTKAAPASTAAVTACSRCLLSSRGNSSISLTPTG